MKLKINGEEKIINSKGSTTSLSMIIEEIGHQPQLIVVEFNGEILHPQKWSSQKVKSGDIIEIVTIVGGGSSF
tara:strand:+ start:2143 stop:2361 length:219 start_codon:yes stop_codon:yes gene_type:complete